jgi:hypothetical protein
MVILNCCQALKVNKGLHSQCLNDKVDEEGDFCKSCQKDADKNGGTPSKGTATARLDPDYTDAKGKAPVNYGNYMKKEGITREAAEAEAAKWGVTISEEQFLVVDAKKGKKGKKNSSDTESDDTTSDAGSVSEPEEPVEETVEETVEEPVEEPVEETVEETVEEKVAPDVKKVVKKKVAKPMPMPKHFDETRDVWNAKSVDEQKEWKKQNKKTNA